MLQPGDCSPSRKVVSKKITRSDVIDVPPTVIHIHDEVDGTVLSMPRGVPSESIVTASL